MNQLSMDFETPSLNVARAMGVEGMRRAAEHAERVEPDFREQAQAFVLAYLAEHGVSSGELITDAAKLAGIRPPDDRAFGSIYAVLSRRNQIAFAGFCLRKKGHSTAGGRIWRLVR